MFSCQIQEHETRMRGRFQKALSPIKSFTKTEDMIFFLLAAESDFTEGLILEKLGQDQFLETPLSLRLRCIANLTRGKIHSRIEYKNHVRNEPGTQTVLCKTCFCPFKKRVSEALVNGTPVQCESKKSCIGVLLHVDPWIPKWAARAQQFSRKMSGYAPQLTMLKENKDVLTAYLDGTDLVEFQRRFLHLIG